MTGMLFVSSTSALSFKNDFAWPLLKGENKAFDIGVKDNENLMTNMRAIFYPGDGDNTLWNTIRTITVGVLLLFIVIAGIKFLLWAPDSEEELKDAKMNLLYLALGAFVIFAWTWVLGTALDISSIEWLSGTENSLVGRVENNIILVVLSFLKWLAFFLAVVFLIYYGYKMMSSFDEDEKLKSARTGILNVFLALMLIKIIDFIYLIAQVQDFKNQAIQLIVQISKFLGYVGGIMFVIAVIYVWFLMLTAKGDDDNIEKAKTMVKSIFTIILIILLFMLVVFQVFNDLL